MPRSRKLDLGWFLVSDKDDFTQQRCSWSGLDAHETTCRRQTDPTDQGLPPCLLDRKEVSEKHPQVSWRAGRDLLPSVLANLSVLIPPFGHLDVLLPNMVLDQAQEICPILHHVRAFCVTALGFSSTPLPS